MSQKETLNAIYKKYKLEPEDIFTHRHYKIISRQGIDKIQAAAKINISYELVFNSPDLKHVVVKAVADMDGQKIETFGECSTGLQSDLRAGAGKTGLVVNNTNSYPFAMAEKRAMSRAVLKLTGFYALGHFGEDEAENFKRPKPEANDGHGE